MEVEASTRSSKSLHAICCKKTYGRDTWLIENEVPKSILDMVLHLLRNQMPGLRILAGCMQKKKIYMYIFIYTYIGYRARLYVACKDPKYQVTCIGLV